MLKREDILNILLELTPKVSQFEKIMTKAERRLRIYCREDIKHIINYQSKNSFYAKNNKVNSESISEIDVYLNNLRDLINSEFSRSASGNCLNFCQRFIVLYSFICVINDALYLRSNSNSK